MGFNSGGRSWAKLERADQRDLTRLERAAETHEAKALDAASRYTELSAERDVRDTMLQPQQAVENQLRAEPRQLDRTNALQDGLIGIKQDLALDPHQEVAQPEVEQDRHLGHERAQVHEVHQQPSQDIDKVAPGWAMTFVRGVRMIPMVTRLFASRLLLRASTRTGWAECPKAGCITVGGP